MCAGHDEYDSISVLERENCIGILPFQVSSSTFFVDSMFTYNYCSNVQYNAKVRAKIRSKYTTILILIKIQKISVWRV